jgi:hypothetical protein
MPGDQEELMRAAYTVALEAYCEWLAEWSLVTWAIDNDTLDLREIDEVVDNSVEEVGIDAGLL